MLLSQWVNGTDGKMLPSQWADEAGELFMEWQVDYMGDIFNTEVIRLNPKTQKIKNGYPKGIMKNVESYLRIE